MREYVVVGSEAQARDHRERGLELAAAVLESLGLVIDVVPANDPFFGRAGAILAANQRDDEAKFELTTEIYPGKQTAIGSGNYHGTHFGDKFALRQADGTAAHSACLAFGMERVVFALAARHGFELAEWPEAVRALLQLPEVGSRA
jgi:seryl-tRNA synthetase